jgi:hypothetical protein
MALSDNVIRDGDSGFVGFASRLNPLTLPAGLLQDSVNMRLDRGVAQTRRGAKRLADSISTADEPLTVPFTLAGDVSITSITFSSTTATVTTATNHGYSNGNLVNIRGATGADASKYNGDFSISAASGASFQYTMTSTPAANATGTLIANKGPLVKTTYAGGIFGAGVFASQNYDNANEYVVMAGPTEAYLWRNASPSDTVVTVGYPTSPDETIAATDTVSIVQAFDRLYILREAPLTAAGFGQQLTNSSGITVSGTTATVNVNSHGFSAGHRVRIEGSTVAAFDGHEFDVLGTSLNTNSFEITVPTGTSNAAVANIKVRRVKPPIYWTGSGSFVRAAGGVPAEGPTYRKMRSTPWVSYINNRLIIPDGRDQVMISDVLDADLYDPFWQSFRAGAGGDDFIVAVHPWVEGTALVFCRKSIWLATISQVAAVGGNGYDIDTAVSKLELLTNEIGCSARNTIVTAGQFVFFLSDAGVYRLDAGRVDLKLRGDTRPLSDPIADLFATVDQTKVQRAFGIWHSNRYVLALPTTAGTDETNNLVVAWNALNDQWEYKDEYTIGVDSLVVGTYANERRTFNIRRTGKLWLLEQNDNGTDDAPTAGLTGSTVQGRIKTRRLNFGEMSSKRFLRSVADVIIPTGGGITTTVSVIDPDKTETIGSITNATGTTEDYHLKSPIRFKAHAAELTFTTTGQRPQIRSAAIEASPKSLPATLTRNES